MTIRITEQGIEWSKKADGCVFRGNKVKRIKRAKKSEELLNSCVSGRTPLSNQLE